MVLGERGRRADRRAAVSAVGPRPQKFRSDIEDEVRYANISIIEDIGASQYGIGMVTARIAEIIARDERAVIPIGCYNPKYGVTLSLPSVVGREGVLEIIEPELSADEQEKLARSADRLKAALNRINVSAPETHRGSVRRGTKVDVRFKIGLR